MTIHIVGILDDYSGKCAMGKNYMRLLRRHRLVKISRVFICKLNKLSLDPLSIGKPLEVRVTVPTRT